MTVDTITPKNRTKPMIERRRCRRYPSAELRAEVKIKKGLFSEWVGVEPCDYNKRGIAIETEFSFEPEQAITLSVTLKMDMGDIRVEKVEGIIRNKIESGPHPRYGIEFNYAANRHMKSAETQSQLGRIEGILERSENLRQRMNEQQSLNHG